MRRRTKIILVLGAVVLLALGWVVFKPEKEPEYQGKKLSEWVLQLMYNGIYSLDKPDPQLEAETAIRTIGTNAIPYLLEWADYEMPNWIDKGYGQLQKFIDYCGFHWEIPPVRREILNAAVPSAFAALGPMADPAAPRLAKFFYKHQGRQNAYFIALALGNIGTNGCNELVTALTNSNVTIRRFAAEGLRTTTNPASAFAIPALLASLHDTNEVVAGAAASAFLLRLRPDLAIPALSAALSEPRPNLQKFAIIGLGRLGSQASNAIPALLPFLNSTNDWRIEATNAIRKIDTNALPK